MTTHIIWNAHNWTVKLKDFNEKPNLFGNISFIQILTDYNIWNLEDVSFLFY